MSCPKIYYFISLIFSLSAVVYSSNCIFENDDIKVNLSRLGITPSWNFTHRLNDSYFETYYLSLCQPLNFSSDPLLDNCTGSYICHNAGSQSTPLFTDLTKHLVIGKLPNFYLFLLGVNETSIKIYFKCGLSLGSPSFLFSFLDSYFFRWETSAVCPDSEAYNRTEVPCYVIDSQGYKRDLSPLILSSGGYKVQTISSFETFILNVCADLVPTSEFPHCEKGFGACFPQHFSGLGAGKVRSPPKLLDDGRIELIYDDPTAKIPYNCHNIPKTTIHFSCPLRDEWGPPKLYPFHNSCNFLVKWPTEYACPSKFLTTKIASCRFSVADHGIDLDLNPLHDPTDVYKINGTVNNETVEFSLNVCNGGLFPPSQDNSPCPVIGVCMYDPTNKSSYSQIGENEVSLSYADGALELKFDSHIRCAETGKTVTSHIEFICDQKAGKGTPQFLHNDNCTYSFVWRTHHACRAQMHYCFFNHGDQFFDFSKLGLNGKATYVTLGSHSKLYEELFINPCSPIFPSLGIHQACPAGSSFCLFRKSTPLSIGHISSWPPTYNETTKEILIGFEGGNACSNSSSKGLLILRCSSDEQEPYLRARSSDGCYYEAIWKTPFACPKKPSTSSNCRVVDPNLGAAFDLNLLAAPDYYSVSRRKNTTYLINICKPVQNSACSNQGNDSIGICQLETSADGQQNTTQALLNTTLTYFDDTVRIEYYNSRKQLAAVLSLFCSPSAGKGSPLWTAETDDGVQIFEWYTSLSCFSPSQDCIARENTTGEIYDLSKLSNITFITDGGSNGTKFYLKICQPLTNVEHCDHNASACRVKYEGKGKESEDIPNLGHFSGLSSIKVPSPDHVMLTYSSGQDCNNKGLATKYTTFIHLMCPTAVTYDGKIQLLRVPDPCLHSFLIMTNSACRPSKLIKKLPSCLASRPLSKEIVDLSVLSRPEGYHVELQDGTKLLMNLCAPLKIIPEANASIIIPPKTIVAIQDDSYISEFGYDISFNFVGQDPHNGARLDYEVNLVCPENHNYSQEIVHQDTRPNLYILKLETPLACPVAIPQCVFTSPEGIQYNLTPLRHRNHGIFTIDANPGVLIKMSLCQALPSKLCKGSSFICLKYWHINESKWFGLGDPHHPPFVRSDGVIVMKFTGGDVCPMGNQSSSATINLICSQKQKTPLFLGGSPQSCSFIFYMETPYACHPKDVAGKGNCKIEDPITKNMLDMSSLTLSNSYYTFTNKEKNSTFLINVCEKLNGDDVPLPCQGAAVCEIQSDSSAAPLKDPVRGFPNATLVFDGGFIKLRYDSREQCHNNPYLTFITTIWFLCDHEHKTEVTILERTECELHLMWHTPMACTQSVETECSVLDEHTGKFYDLSPLKYAPKRHLVYSYMSIVEIGVCKGLDYSFDESKKFALSHDVINCTHDTGVCLFLNDHYPGKIVSLSLGKVSPPKIVNGDLVLLYENGSPCSSDPSQNASATIVFACHELSSFDREMDFTGQDNCHYTFYWDNAAACPVDQYPRQNGTCSVTNPFTDYKFKFNSLFEKLQNQSVHIEHDLARLDGNTDISFLASCDPSANTPCGAGVGICQMTNGTVTSVLGTLENAALEYTSHMLVLTYGAGDRCGNGNKTARIVFICSAEEKNPYISDYNPCFTTIIWKTLVACESSVQCSYVRDGKIIDVRDLFEPEKKFTYLTTHNGSNLVFINLCGPLPPFTLCPPNAAACITTNGTDVNLGQAQQDIFTNEAGEPVLVYTNGSPCSDNPDGLGYRSKITFPCDPQAGRGNPILISDANCIFEFLWPNSLVCSKEVDEDIIDDTECIFSYHASAADFDLSPLKRKGPFKVKDANFTIGLCSTLATENCTRASICHQGPQGLESYGDLKNMTFHYTRHRLILDFSSNIPCLFSQNGKKGATIEFICSHKTGLGAPKLIKSSQCKAYFHWPTELVCQEKRPSCIFTANGWNYNFKPLSSFSHNWNATDEHNNWYWLNLCHRLVDGDCDPDSVACMRRDGEKEILSIGLHLFQKISVDDEENIVMTFHRGFNCSNTTASTEIKFICGPTTEPPRFAVFDPPTCTYKFEWVTHYACKSYDVHLQEFQGLVYDPRIQKAFNVTRLLESSFNVSAEHHLKDDYVFLISLQEGLGSSHESFGICTRAAVCQTKPGSHFYRDVGTYLTRQFVVQSNGSVSLVLTSHGRACGKNSAKNVTTIIRLACSEANLLGSPKFIYESADCDYIFDWDTDVLCHKNLIDISGKEWEHFTKTGHLGQQSEAITSNEVTPYTNPLPIILGLVAAFLLLLPILYIVSSQERRSSAQRRLRNLLTTHRMPKFLYRKGAVQLLDDDFQM